jgi:uncharacterized protein YggU (UPF0235/DUF167 family)
MAKNNQANQAIIKILANYLHLPVSCFVIKSGRSNKNKIIEIYEKQNICS